MLKQAHSGRPRRLDQQGLRTTVIKHVGVLTTIGGAGCLTATRVWVQSTPSASMAGWPGLRRPGRPGRPAAAPRLVHRLRGGG